MYERERNTCGDYGPGFGEVLIEGLLDDVSKQEFLERAHHKNGCRDQNQENLGIVAGHIDGAMSCGLGL
ncbi:MAG: hypothetical protein U5K37_01325 [Natrialbaceae archaeon]|nr:hypothetical protein [Natrialbaceae archaeon]